MPSLRSTARKLHLRYPLQQLQLTVPPVVIVTVPGFQTCSLKTLVANFSVTGHHGCKQPVNRGCMEDSASQPLAALAAEHPHRACAVPPL